MGGAWVFNMPQCMQECERMGGLSNSSESAIIINEMRKNASVFHSAFSTSLAAGRERDVENAFWTADAYYTRTEGKYRAER